ncbi:MAG: hypothetical protein O3A00_04120 [Planctomycetota bacterium]|nr:hypothetical protein [Planctomycetota bacterium]
MDQSNDESVDPTINAVLTITGSGSGTVGLDVALTVDATDAGSGNAIIGTDYAVFGTQPLTFSTGDGATNNSSNSTLVVTDDQRLEGDETVDIGIGNLSSNLNGQVSLADIAHTATIEDNETGVIDFQADQSNAESVDSTINATLTIGGSGTGTVGLDVVLTVDVTDAGSGTTISGTDYAAFGTQTITFSTGDGATNTSSDSTLDVTDDRRLEGDETVDLQIGNLSSDLNGQVSLNDTTHTATIEDNETGVVEFQTDQSNSESVDPTVNAVLTINGTGSGTDGLDVPLTVDTTDAGSGSATSTTDYAAFGTQAITFAVGDGATINSTNAVLDVIDDQRLEGDETIDLAIGNLSSTLDGQVALGDTTHTATIEDNEIGVIDFQVDQSNDESVDPTVTAVLTITGSGTGTIGLDVVLTVTAADLGSGTAVSGTDYTAFGTQTLTISTGDGMTLTSSNASLDAVDDQRLEGDETIDLAIGNLSSTLDGQVSISDSTHTATITDNETGVIDFQADQSNGENVAPTANATLTITGSGSGTVGLDVALTVDATDAGSGSSISGTDYTAFGTQTLTISAADGASLTSNNSTLDVTDDQRLEGDETVDLQIGSLSSDLNGRVSLNDTTHTATIEDNETGVIDFQADQSNAESIDPSINATLTITGSGSGTIGLDVTLTVDATNAGSGGATSGTDFANFGTQTITFVIGDGASLTSTDSTLDVTDDQRLEGDETVDLSIGNLSSTLDGQVSLNDVTHTATIEDNETGTIDFQPDQSNVESIDPTMNATLSITGIGSGTIGLDVSLTVDATDAGGGTATSGADYTAFGTQTLTIATGDGASITSTDASLDVTIDAVVEDHETVNLEIGNLSNDLDGQVSLNDTTHVPTILNDDTATLTISDLTETETDSDQTFDFTVSIDAAIQGGFDLAFALGLGTAESSDVSLVTGSPLAFSGTVNESHTVTVTLHGDDIVEDHETFTLTLGDVTNSSAEQDESITTGAIGNGTINNDDTASLSISAPSITESDSNQTVQFTVTLDAAVEGGFDVAFSDALGDAETTDFSVITNGPLSFLGNVNEQLVIDVNIVGEQIVEADETFTITLGDVTNTTAVQDLAITTGAADTGTIDNDDSGTLSVAETGEPQIEGNSPVTVTFTFTVTLDAPVEGGFSIGYVTSDGTAANGNATLADGDYIDNDAAISFTGAAGEQYDITVLVNGDQKVELDEVFNVALESALGNLQTGIDANDITIDTTPATGTILNDDSATIRIDDISLDEGDSGVTAFTFTVTLDAEVDAAVDVDFSTATITGEAEDENGPNSGNSGGDDSTVVPAWSRSAPTAESTKRGPSPSKSTAI